MGKQKVDPFTSVVHPSKHDVQLVDPVVLSRSRRGSRHTYCWFDLVQYVGP